MNLLDAIQKSTSGEAIRESGKYTCIANASIYTIKNRHNGIVREVLKEEYRDYIDWIPLNNE